MLPAGETVVLVHGLWLSGFAMGYLRRGLERRGCPAVSYSYPTVRLDLDRNAERLARYCERQAAGKVHLVGHSLGGLVALAAAQRLPRAKLGRIVMLGSPYQDCYAGRRVQRLPWGRSILGRAMGQWIEMPRGELPGHLDVGVVAGVGRVGLGRIFAPGLPQPNDGVVSVEETRVPGMRDRVVVRASHTLMLVSSEVVHQACAYLEHGNFDHARGAVVS